MQFLRRFYLAFSAALLMTDVGVDLVKATENMEVGEDLPKRAFPLSTAFKTSLNKPYQESQKRIGEAVDQAIQGHYNQAEESLRKVASKGNCLAALLLSYFEYKKGDLLTQCLVPEYDGIKYENLPSKEDLWDRYYTGAPQRQRECVEQYKIVKKA